MTSRRKSFDRRPRPEPDLRRFELDGGWIVLVGKSAVDNDLLTFQHAFPQDTWLHAKGCAGSHVVVQHPTESEPPVGVLQAAAKLAVEFSKARKGGLVAVDFCRVADVARIKGAAPGKVALRKSRTLKIHTKA